jgi:hypothetical protein
MMFQFDLRFERAKIAALPAEAIEINGFRDARIRGACSFVAIGSRLSLAHGFSRV